METTRKAVRDRSHQMLLQLMQARGATPEDVAKVAGCTRELVYLWRQGKRAITDQKLQLLADFFGVDVRYMKYGSHALDTDTLAQVVAGSIEALVAEGVITAGVSPQQIGHLIAQTCADYEADGEVNVQQIQTYIKMMAPWASPASHLKQ